MKKYIYSLLVGILFFSCNKFYDLFPPPTHQASAGALDFDGVNDEVNTGDWFRYQVFTIQLWVKPGSTQNPYAAIIDNEHDSFVSWVIQQNGGQTNKYYFGGGVLLYFPLQADVWQQVSLVRSETSAQVYVDGKLVDSAPLITKTISYHSSHTLRLGQWSGGERAWNGQMDEVRLWNRALSKNEIKDNFACALNGSENGLVAYYKFNQGYVSADNSTVKLLPDQSKYNHDGTLQNFALNGNRSNWVAGNTFNTCR